MPDRYRQTQNATYGLPHSPSHDPRVPASHETYGHAMKPEFTAQWGQRGQQNSHISVPARQQWRNTNTNSPPQQVPKQKHSIPQVKHEHSAYSGSLSGSRRRNRLHAPAITQAEPRWLTNCPPFVASQCRQYFQAHGTWPNEHEVMPAVEDNSEIPHMAYPQRHITKPYVGTRSIHQRSHNRRQELHSQPRHNLQAPTPQPCRSLQDRVRLQGRPGPKELFDPKKHSYGDQTMRHKDYASYNDTYAAQKAFRAIPKLEKSGANLRYWACLIRPLVLPSPVHHPQLLLHQLALSAAHHEVLSDMIQSAALRAADFKQEHQREAQAMTGLRMIMETLDAQVGTKKQIEAERFRKFWRCRHKPAGVHNKAWGLFVSQISSLFQAIKDTLSIDTFLDQLITVIDTTYHSGVYQGLVDIVQATMLRYAITDGNLQLVLSEIIRVGKAYERVRTLPARTTRTNNTTTSRVKNITPFPGHRDNPIALTTIPLEETACDDQHPWLHSPHQCEEGAVPRGNTP